MSSGVLGRKVDRGWTPREEEGGRVTGEGKGRELMGVKGVREVAGGRESDEVEGRDRVLEGRYRVLRGKDRVLEGRDLMAGARSEAWARIPEGRERRVSLNKGREDFLNSERGGFMNTEKSALFTSKEDERRGDQWREN
jgi:hypothetical protein